MPHPARLLALLLLLPMLLLAACSSTPRSAAPWLPAGTAAHLMTKWGSEVTPDRTPLPEYPRPTLIREQWLNLNGLWDVTVIRPGQPPSTPRPILVPFPYESALSGIGEMLTGEEQLLYTRTFKLPRSWPAHARRILLHFGAANWHAEIAVNGHPLATHDGGYDPFSIDITEALLPGDNALAVTITNPVNRGGQPRGKQWLNPHGIWYTPSTGLWQTVWLEPVPDLRVNPIEIAVDTPSGPVQPDGSVRMRISGDDSRYPNLMWHAHVSFRGKPVGTLMARLNQEDTLPIRDPRLWSPDDPALYDVRVEIVSSPDAGGSLDTYQTYFALRSVSLVKDAQGHQRLALNGQPIFHYGPLDQGFWPDGLYTAPTDDALKFDIQAAKRMGCNMIRKHVKVEPERWYYWCDRLGIMVWQDMPSAFFKSKDFDEGAPQIDDHWKANFERELDAMIAARRCHPSIVMWVPFNEGWGQNDLDWSRRVAQHVKHLDPTRLVNCATGWTDTGVCDTRDIHAYPDPALPPIEANRAAVLGEFGGLGLPVEHHTWVAKNNWGYRTYTSPEEVTAAYLNLLDQFPPLIAQGLAAAVYTQTTDVEVECNGWLTYDRALWKIDPDQARPATLKLYAPAPHLTPLLNRARTDSTDPSNPHTWRYTTAAPDPAWAAPSFDDSRWPTGPAGFGTRGTPGAIVHTLWSTPDIYLRTTFTLDTLPAHPMLDIHHDEDAEVYINGHLAATLKGFTTTYRLIPLTKEAAATLHPGPNTLAIHCHQTTGGQYIDCGLVDVTPPQ